LVGAPKISLGSPGFTLTLSQEGELAMAARDVPGYPTGPVRMVAWTEIDGVDNVNEPEWIEADQGESGPIKPNQTKSNLLRERKVSRKWTFRRGKGLAECGLVKLSQTESKRFDLGLTTNQTILSDLLMLIP